LLAIHASLSVAGLPSWQARGEWRRFGASLLQPVPVELVKGYTWRVRSPNGR
jgi:hypothetical protein